MVRRTTSPVSVADVAHVDTPRSATARWWSAAAEPRTLATVAQRRLPAGQSARAIGAGGRTCPSAGPGSSAPAPLGRSGDRRSAGPRPVRRRWWWRPASTSRRKRQRQRHGLPRDPAERRVAFTVQRGVTTAIPTVQLRCTPRSSSPRRSLPRVAPTPTGLWRSSTIRPPPAGPNPKTEGCPGVTDGTVP